MRGEVGFPVRLRFSKRGKVRFVGHRDLARGFERAFRTTQLPLAFSQGFSPRPKISLGLALGVGYESDAEYLDLELREPIALEWLPRVLGDALPEGVAVDAAVPLVPRAPALQESITSVEYHLTPAALRAHQLGDAVEQVLAARELPVETTRKGRRVVEDLRPGIRHLTLLDDRSVHVEVATKPRGIRPAELLGALHDVFATSRDAGEDRVLRTRQWIERDGARHEPLAADRTPRASAAERASAGGASPPAASDAIEADARDTSKGLIDVGRHDDRHTEPGEPGFHPRGVGTARRIA